MLSRRDCYLPTRNSMAPIIERSSEAIRQEALQAEDNKVKPYDIFGNLEKNGTGRPRLKCLQELDREFLVD